MKKMICILLFALAVTASYSQNPDGHFNIENCYMEIDGARDTVYQFEFIPILYHGNESYMNLPNQLYIVPNSPNTEGEMLPTQQVYEIGEEVDVYLLTDGIEIYGNLHRVRGQWFFLYLDGTSSIVDFLSKYGKHYRIRINRA